MTIHKHAPAGGQSASDNAEIEVLLDRIQDERIPERLLTLAQELQDALTLRKKQLALAGKH